MAPTTAFLEHVMLSDDVILCVCPKQESKATVECVEAMWWSMDPYFLPRHTGRAQNGHQPRRSFALCKTKRYRAM